MNKVISRIAFAMLAITFSQPLAFSQEFVSSSARSSSPSFENFTNSLEATAYNMAKSYDERCAQAARNHWIHTSASNMSNLPQQEQAFNQSATQFMLSNNGTNQGGFNQGNNQGNNGFFGGGFPGGVGLPQWGFGGADALSGSLFGSPFFGQSRFNNQFGRSSAFNPNPSVEPVPGRFTRTTGAQINRTAARQAAQQSGPF